MTDSIRTREQIDAHNEREWARVRKVFGQRPGTVVAWCVVATEAEQHRQQARFEREFSQFRQLNYSLTQLEGASLYTPLKKWLQQQEPNPKPTLVHITDIEKLGDKLASFIAELNFHREQLFRNVGASLVFWSDEATQIRVQNGAPDFWDWVAYCFRFETFFEPVSIQPPPIERENTRPRQIQRLRTRLAALEPFKNRGGDYALEWAQLALELAERLPLNQNQEANALLTECQRIFQTENQPYREAQLWRIAGDRNLQTGKLSEAKNAYQKYLEITQTLAKANPDSEQIQREWAVANARMGDVAIALGQPLEARKFFEKDLEISQVLAKANPDSEQTQREWAVANARMGDLAIALGQPLEARKFFEQYLTITQALAQANPDSEQIQREWAVANAKMGDVYRALDSLDKAHEYFNYSIEILKKIHAFNPDSFEVRRYIAVIYSRLGDLAVDSSDLPKALSFYEQTRKELGNLMGEESISNEVKYLLAKAYCKMGEIKLAMGATSDAKHFFEAYLDSCKALTSDFPESKEYQRELGVAFSKMGDTYLKLGDINAAKSFYEEDLNISKTLAETDEFSERTQIDLATSLKKMSEFEYRYGKNTQIAYNLIHSASEIVERLSKMNPYSKEIKKQKLEIEKIKIEIKDSI